MTPRQRLVLGGALAAVTLLVPSQVRGQLEIRGYALGVGSYAGDSDFVDAGATWFGRGRGMLTWDADELSFEAAYEHVLQRQPAGGGFGITSPGGSRVSTDWLPLDWTIHESERSSWRHRFDRLGLRWARGPLEVAVGRQTISWATTLFLTPADPFAPFDPSDPFREYSGGVDALRVRASTGPFTEIEAVVRPADTPEGTTMTALGRVATSRGTWAFGAWGGILHDEAAGALFTTGAVGATSVRSEVALRRGLDGGVVLRASAGLDRFFQPTGRDLFAILEVQYDGYGASDADELLAVAQSPAYGRGDLQVLGQWTLAAQASWQVHPLIAVDALGLVNLLDPSLLFAPGVSWSTTGSASTRLGLFFGAGDGATGPFSLGSEYGSVPAIGYLSGSIFF
jgi:hypothetical protein